MELFRMTPYVTGSPKFKMAAVNPRTGGLEYGKAALPIPSAIQSGSDDLSGVKMVQTPLHFSMEN